MKHLRKQSGVALVITLIMLSVITIIAVAFLALSQRERSAVATTLTGTEAELAARAGHERAKAEILANIREFVNTYTNRQTIGPDLFVSRAEPYYGNFNAPNFNFNDLLTVANYHSELTNLFYDPAPPVFSTNRTGVLEQVHYLDLNRNGRYESNGFIRVLDNSGVPIPGTPPETNYVVGDPQWIGVTARPNEPHSSSNRFAYRYAFLVAPAGRTLDIDYIHNHAKHSVGLNQPGFHRKQGHGTWELNLAAFLTDLNTNEWGQYNYNTNLFAPSTLQAFEHAQGILRHRYANNQLRNARDIFGTLSDAFADDGIDQYGDGDDWNASANKFVDNDAVPAPIASRAWPGSSNPRHFFSIHDFYNLKTAPMNGFYGALTNTGFARNSYDAHTFYRMLAQIGTDSVPEKMRVRRNDKGDFVDSARINLNYVNTNTIVAADFEAWDGKTFFEVAADRLLRTYGFSVGNVPLSVTNLPIYPTNYYTPAVHRILQMTLNIFDATTNQGNVYPFYPTPLRPVFESSSGGGFVKIVGYERIPQSSWVITNAANWKHLSNATDRAALNATTPNQFVYGIPILIGAKKGFPNFNEYVHQSIVQVERKVNIEKLGNVVRTNQLVFMGISNVFGVEAWNSYSSPYPRDLIMVTGLEQHTVLTNNEGFTGFVWPNYPSTDPVVAFSPMLIPANAWRGGEFQIPLAGVTLQNREGHAWTNVTVLTNSIYSSRNRLFYATNQVQLAIDPGVFAAPQWVLATTHRFRFFLFDNGHLIDAVGLAPNVEAFNITEALHRMSEQGANDPSFGAVAPDENYWLTNRMGGAAPTQTRAPTRGLQNQIDRARRGTPMWGGDANRSALEALGFRQFLALVTNPTNDVRTNMWVPFVPQQKVYHNYIWQANDPLVHYLAEDLRFKTNSRPRFSPVNSPTFDMFTIGRTNGAYQPWGGPLSQDPEQRSSDVFNPRTTDMNVRRSDDWDFPTNKNDRFVSIGMLGRVHRGSPWQTAYFKSDPPDDPTWAKLHQGGRRSNPTNDWRIVDVFTVAQHPNSSYGRLSVNQTNVAAWSAVLGGIDVSTIADVGGKPTVVLTNVQPAHVDNNRTIEKLVEAVNFHRTTRMTGEVFSSLSEVLGVPELTSKSLFLTAPFVANPPQISDSPLRDKDVEAIPQKILSLIQRGEPRFVIYAFGQSLKPAPQSILTGGPYRGLVTNYEVSGEMASRAVVRIEFDNNRRPYTVVESFNFLPPD